MAAGFFAASLRNCRTFMPFLRRTQPLPRRCRRRRPSVEARLPCWAHHGFGRQHLGGWHPA